MNNNRPLLILLPILVLSGCFQNRPPDGYEAIPALDSGLANSQCPDLTGSFDLSRHPLGRAISDQAAPDAKGLPLRMSFKQGPIHIEAWWVVPKDSLRNWAEQESQNNPAGYSRWLALATRQPTPQSTDSEQKAFRNAVAKLGPPATPVFAGIVNYRCAENWSEIRDQPRSEESPDGFSAEGMGETEIWLARDKSGALLMKTLRFKVKPFHVWGDANTTIRTSSTAFWSKVEESPFADPVPLKETDLPAAPQKSSVRSCDEMISQLADLTNRIIASIPTGVFLVNSRIQSDESDYSLDQCQGKGKILELHFSGKESEQLAKLDQQILDQPEVRSVTVLPNGDETPGFHRLKVVLK